MELHERMKAIQTDSDIKIKALAVELAVSPTALSNYLNGSRSMPYDVLARFAQFYNVTTDYLLGLTDEREVPMRISAAEKRLLEEFRTLSAQQKELTGKMVHFMREQNR